MRTRALLALPLVLAACGGQLASDKQDERRIGFVPKSLNQEYWVNTQKGAQAGAKAGNAKLLTHAAGDDTQIVEQIDIVENLLAQDVDALVVAPSDSNLPKPVLEKPAQRMPVVLFDSDIPGWKP
jgi:ribose transport system substrate-binding protein